MYNSYLFFSINASIKYFIAVKPVSQWEMFYVGETDPTCIFNDVFVNGHGPNL